MIWRQWQMKMLEMNLNKIISENELPQGSVIVFRFIFGEMDVGELAKIAEYVHNFFKKRNIDTIFLPDVIEIDSINNCKQVIENLSKKLYEYSELQDKLLEERERYELF